MFTTWQRIKLSLYLWLYSVFLCSCVCKCRLCVHACVCEVRRGILFRLRWRWAQCLVWYHKKKPVAVVLTAHVRHYSMFYCLYHILLLFPCGGIPLNPVPLLLFLSFRCILFLAVAVIDVIVLVWVCVPSASVCVEVVAEQFYTSLLCSLLLFFFSIYWRENRNAPCHAAVRLMCLVSCCLGLGVCLLLGCRMAFILLRENMCLCANATTNSKKKTVTGCGSDCHPVGRWIWFT